MRKHFDLDVLPLYVRAGSIVPLGPVSQYATERPDAPYEIRIFPGANARFMLYEDDNETYDYERGQFATYELTWDDANRRLTIGGRKGSFPEMIRTRTLNIVLAKRGENQGIGGPAGSSQTVLYDGAEVELNFADR